MSSRLFLKKISMSPSKYCLVNLEVIRALNRVKGCKVKIRICKVDKKVSMKVASRIVAKRKRKRRGKMDQGSQARRMRGLGNTLDLKRKSDYKLYLSNVINIFT